MKRFHLLIFLILVAALGAKVEAKPKNTTTFIKIDQLGYRVNAQKVAVISDPQIGFNSGESFQPSTAQNQYEVRNWETDEVVFSGTITPWKNGQTDQLSGDKAWWFDFSSVKTPGNYYIYDSGKKVGSYNFYIGNEVYNDLLKAAMRFFFYQRQACDRPEQFAGKWADGPTWTKALQDTEARSIYDKNNPATAKDLSGGWMDAGDPNKYVTFANNPIQGLLSAYEEYPGIWGDNYNIPESGNGIPDILDEIKWEIDWLKKMQLEDGAVILKMGVARSEENGTWASPLSKDTHKRYYYPKGCTSSTIAFASSLAHAAAVFKTIPEWTDYAADLITRAEKAFANYQSIPVKQENGDDGSIMAGDADWKLDFQNWAEVQAAVYLFAATGNTKYRDFVDKNWIKLKTEWWGPFEYDYNHALLAYTKLPKATISVINAIKQKKQNNTTWVEFYKWNKPLDAEPYRSETYEYCFKWGGNGLHACIGVINEELVNFGIDVPNHPKYLQRAEECLHYLNGVNPMGINYLTNMSSYGAERSVNEIFHTWFWHGTDYDNVETSKFGPAPGYLTGGPDKDYSMNGACTLKPPCNQPWGKSFLEFNDNNQNAWTVTEPAIYYQSALVQFLAAFVNGSNPSPATGSEIIAAQKNDTAKYITNAIAIDGLANEAQWKTARWNDVVKLSSGENKSLNSVRFRTYQNDSCLYFTLNVKDNKLSNTNPDVAQNSGIELFLDLNLDRSNSIKTDDFHFIFPWNKTTVFEQSNRTAGVIYKTTNISGGYNMEILIPFKTLGLKPEESKLIGFDCGQNLSSAGNVRTGKLVWNGNALDSTSTLHYGNLFIAPKSPTAINIQDKNAEPEIYPNPASDLITVITNGNANVQIFNLFGECVKQQTITTNEKINVKNLTNGTYLVALRNAGYYRHFKLVVQH